MQTTLYEIQKYPIIWSLRNPAPERIKQYKKSALKIIEQLVRE